MRSPQKTWFELIVNNGGPLLLFKFGEFAFLSSRIEIDSR
jgi:hypothetical protein